MSNKPLYRVSFSRITGKNEDGSDKLGNIREIGAIWKRKGDKEGGILSFDHVPAEIAQHQGVIFITPVA